MSKLILNIDGYIGPWGYSKQWVNQMLLGHENDEVEVIVSSLGGRVDDGLGIHYAFQKHGNVNVIFVGFVASMATILGQGAKKRVMNENSLFLIHKPMSWIDEFGYMNEDDIETLIARLEKEKNETAKLTLQLAKIYATSSGNPIQDILNLMKEETWLNAEEALEWGFIDEIESLSQSSSPLENMAQVAMLTVNGFNIPEVDKRAPKPTVKHTPKENSVQTQTQKPMNKSLIHINTVLDVEGFEASDEGVFLNTEQLESINAHIETQAAENLRLVTEAQESATTIGTLTENLETANLNVQQGVAENERLTNEAATANEALLQSRADLDIATASAAEVATFLNGIHPTVQAAETMEEKVNAIRAILVNKPGVANVGVLNNQDPGTANDNVDWATINALPHNRNVD